MIKHIISQPKLVFLLDGLGALVSTLFLGVVLVAIQTRIGLPVHILYLLAGIAFCLLIFSSACYFMLKKNWKPFLIGVATGNFLYSLITGCLMFAYRSQMTQLGFAYFIGEILVLWFVVWIEYRAIQNL